MHSQERINLFVAFDESYAQHGCVMLVSMLENNPDQAIDCYILTDGLSEKSRGRLASVAGRHADCRLDFRVIDDAAFRGLKLNIPHISRHTYYRYAIAELFPQVDKALYLDTDLVVQGSLEELWNMELGDFLCAGVCDRWIERIHYKPEIGFEQDELYINAGVLLLNLAAMRREKLFDRLCDTTRQMEDRIRFQDQDVINIVCRGRILELPDRFNFTTEHVRDYPERSSEAVIVHYTGARKPWSSTLCPNALKGLYYHYLTRTPYRSVCFGLQLCQAMQKVLPAFLRKKPSGPKPLRVALIVDEFFGGGGTAFGGIGFLARNYIAKYIPCDDIRIDVLIGRHHGLSAASRIRVDDVFLYRLPGRHFIARWLKRKRYDLYFSPEMTWDMLSYEGKSHTPLLFWVQDPRPWTDWLEIQTVGMYPETCYWKTSIYESVHRLYAQGRVSFVSQGRYLADKARILYRLAEKTPVAYLPNPIDVETGFDPETCVKRDEVVFVGRIASVKRAWLFCEIARRMPEYEFYLVGQAQLEKERNEAIMAPYRTGIPNLHFVGHLEGEAKFRRIREAKILINTSIHEALPVTFLEALACGTLLVSCQDPDGMTSRFGIYIGPVLGDGFDKVDLFVDAVRTLMGDEARRKELSVAACEYVKTVHGVGEFIRNTRRLIRETVRR
ncbi:glycosyltransferase [Alistipes sp.]|uniref:glycosyltransferase n=1 Tax=Alistipes sp. TaxID=1872444 RepID=UPI0025BA52E1|nr:glycosyltransferase [Alistipes sp.]